MLGWDGSYASMAPVILHLPIGANFVTAAGEGL